AASGNNVYVLHTDPDGSTQIQQFVVQPNGQIVEGSSEVAVPNFENNLVGTGTPAPLFVLRRFLFLGNPNDTTNPGNTGNFVAGFRIGSGGALTELGT